MKIGLEFEGVIRSRQTCEIARWSRIDPESQRRIKKLLYTNRRLESVDPCDRYDALAEVRTPPIVNPTAEKLVTALFTEMELATQAFNANGYDIQWWEQPIPQKLHDEIRNDFNLVDPDGKKEKYTQTIRGYRTQQYISEGNLFRGGGLHINISSIPHIFAVGFILGLHNHLSDCKKDEFQSHYRTNLLFRTRYDDVANNQTPNEAIGNNSIVEYMSHGFNVDSLKDWQKEWAEHTNRGYGYPPKFSWAPTLMRYLTEFMGSSKYLK